MAAVWAGREERRHPSSRVLAPGGGAAPSTTVKRHPLSIVTATFREVSPHRGCVLESRSASVRRGRPSLPHARPPARRRWAPTPAGPARADMDRVPAQPASPENLARYISGELGPAPMRGVQTFPYTVPQRLYHKDFSAVVASTIQHPFMTTAKPCGSTPHNILSGSCARPPIALPGSPFFHSRRLAPNSRPRTPARPQGLQRRHLQGDRERALLLAKELHRRTAGHGLRCALGADLVSAASCGPRQEPRRRSHSRLRVSGACGREMRWGSRRR